MQQISSTTVVGEDTKHPQASSNRTTIAHDGAEPSLSGLPAELKNSILELVLPTGTLIYFRAESIATVNGERPRYHFLPMLPPLCQTSQQLRTELPMGRYYTENSFLIGDSMLQPGVLSAFMEAGKSAIKDVERVCVTYNLSGTTTRHRADGPSRWSTVLRRNWRIRQEKAWCC